MRSRVTIVDDHALFAGALAKLLEPYCDVVGVHSDPVVFLTQARTLMPDIALVDLLMPAMNGFEVARKLREVSPTPSIIFLTMNEDPDIAAEAFRLGAAGYLLKRSAGSELETAVREVTSARRYTTPLLARRLAPIATPLGATDRSSGIMTRITSRQREVLRLVAAGRSMKEIGALLNLSVRTVAFHKYRMMEQLQVHSTAALIQFAVKEGLV